eukprot:6478495-Amphidinium_carterae.1
MNVEELQRRLIALETSNQQLSQALGQATNEIASLQAQQQQQAQQTQQATVVAQQATAAAAAGALPIPAPHRSIVDTRVLQKTSNFEGDQQKWSLWSFLFRAYCDAVHPDLGGLMDRAVAATSPIYPTADREKELAQQLFLMLALSTSGRALEKIRSCSYGEGLECWRQLHVEYEPRQPQRFSAMLSALLKVEFKEPLDTSIEQWERDIAVYESQSRERLPDHIRLALLQSNMAVPRIREHLTLNSVTRYEDARQEIMNILSAARTWVSGGGKAKQQLQHRAHQTLPSSQSPGQSKPRAQGACLCCGKTGHVKAQCRFKEAFCNLCGKQGHLSAVCRKAQAPAQAAASTPNSSPSQPKGKGKGKGKKGEKGVNAVEEKSEQPEVLETLACISEKGYEVMSVSECQVVAGVTCANEVLMADSGAMRSVCDSASFPNVEMSDREPPQLYFITGESLDCKGVKRINVCVGQHRGKVDLTVANVRKNVVSLPELADQGFTIVLSGGKSYVSYVTPPLPPDADREDLVRINRLWYFQPHQEMVAAASSSAGEVATESTAEEIRERKRMEEEDKLVYAEVDQQREWDLRYVYTTRRDQKAWCFRSARQRDPFKNSDILRRATYCGKTGRVIQDLLAADNEGGRWNAKLPGDLPRHIMTKFWYSKRALPLEVVRRETESAPTSVGLPTPASLTSEAMEEHCLTHCPYEEGCIHCQAGRGRGEMHRRKVPTEPIVEIDWSYWSSADHSAPEPSPGALCSVTVVHRQSGMTLSSAVEAKGRNSYAEDLVTRWLSKLDLAEIQLRLDGEPASKTFAKALEQRLRGRHVKVHESQFTTRASHQSIGGAERAHALIGDLVRTLLSQLQAGSKWVPSVRHPVFVWLLRHAGYIRSYHQQGTDGLTPSVRKLGRGAVRRMAMYGESVLAQMGEDKKGKLAPRWVQAVFVGIQENMSTSSAQFIVLTRQGAMLSRSIKRLTVENRWNKELLESVIGLPWALRAMKVEHLSHERTVAVPPPPAALSQTSGQGASAPSQGASAPSQGASASSQGASASSQGASSSSQRAVTQSELATALPATGEPSASLEHEATWLATPT